MKVNTVIHNLKTICGQKGISIRELEMMCQFNNGSIVRWIESNSSTLDTLVQLSMALDVSIDELLYANQFDDTFVKALAVSTNDGSLVWQEDICPKWLDITGRKAYYFRALHSGSIFTFVIDMRYGTSNQVWKTTVYVQMSSTSSPLSISCSHRVGNELLQAVAMTLKSSHALRFSLLREKMLEQPSDINERCSYIIS